MKPEEVAKMIVHPEKGILAADWSVGTATKKFEKFGIPTDAETRRKYRQILFTTEGLENCISAVILHEETIKQKTDDGLSFVEVLKEKGILSGVRLDIGQEELPGFLPEQITFGLDGIRKKLLEYKEMGAVFAKWRAAYFIDRTKPSRVVMEANSILLALYSLFCLEVDILPIVEPDVLMDGDHSLEECAIKTEEVLRVLFQKLSDFGVDRKKVLLKPSMVLPGKESGLKATPSEVSRATLDVFEKVVPVDVSGIAFLSGGQTLEEAAYNLNEIEKNLKPGLWPVIFSFARALQEPVLEVWKGKDENIKEAQSKLVENAITCSLARQGRLESKGL